MKLLPLFESTSYPTDALLARVSAGHPIEIGDEIEQVDLNYMLTHGNPYAMLIRVKGESMSDEIKDGDWVMIDRKREPKQNDIVLAQVSGGYTVKRFKLNGHNLYLVPSNEIFKPKEVNESDGFEVIGVVTSIIRSYI